MFITVPIINDHIDVSLFQHIYYTLYNKYNYYLGIFPYDKHNIPNIINTNPVH